MASGSFSTSASVSASAATPSSLSRRHSSAIISPKRCHSFTEAPPAAEPRLVRGCYEQTAQQFLDDLFRRHEVPALGDLVPQAIHQVGTVERLRRGRTERD